MLIAFDIEIPKDIEAAAGVDTRYTFRRTVENRMRPRFNQLLRQVEEDTIYPKLAQFYLVEQVTTEDSVSFALINLHPAARYLEAPEGTVPHTIVQAEHVIPFGNLVEFFSGDNHAASIAQYVLANRDIIIEHPGTAPDQPVIDDVADAETNILAATEDAMEVWAQRFGAVVA